MSSHKITDLRYNNHKQARSDHPHKAGQTRSGADLWRAYRKARTLVDEDRDHNIPSSRRTLPQKADSDFHPNHVHTVVETGGRPGIEGGLWL